MKTPLGLSALSWLSVAVAAVLSLFWIRRRWGPRWRAVRSDIRQACTCGHVPPPPTEADQRWLRRVARCLVGGQIGRVTVHGSEHLDHDTAPSLLVANHGHYLDPFVLALAVTGPVRCMTAHGLMSAVGGLAALPLRRWGAFCTDLRPGRGAPAARAAIRLLRAGESVLLFPEGWAHLDGAVRPFKPGATMIARAAANGGRWPMTIVPIRLQYGTYPGPWIGRLPTHLQYLTMLLGLLAYRRGVEVMIGEPVFADGLPECDEVASRMLRDAVLAVGSTVAD